MRNRIHFFWKIVGILFVTVPSFAVDLKGVARPIDGGDPIYIEKHEIEEDEKGLNKKIITEYTRPDGTLIARKVSDFSKNPTVPETSFEDLRFKKKEELTFQEGQKKLVMRVNQNGKETQKEFSVKENMVTGQGFDNFVKINFDKLKQSRVGMLFGVIAKLDFFNFFAVYKKTENDRSTFGLRVENVVLRLFVSELKVEYDTKSKQLMKYTGLSNLVDDKGKDQNVIIDYETIKL